MAKKKDNKIESNKAPIFFIEGAAGAKKLHVLALLKNHYADVVADAFDKKSMKDAKDGVVALIEASPYAEADAMAIVDGGGWHFLNATGAVKDKEAALRKIMAVASKHYAPVMVVVASSKRDAEMYTNAHISSFVAESEKFVQLYKRKDGLPIERLFVNTTYESDEKILKRILKKAAKAVKLRK